MTEQLPTRRRMLAGTGALLVSFSLSGTGLAQQGEVQGAKQATGPKLPGALGEQPMLDAWIRIDANGAATVFTGKVELGQGIKTALLQVAADELALPHQLITLVTADTARTCNEGYTAGSLSMHCSMMLQDCRMRWARTQRRSYESPFRPIGMSNSTSSYIS